MEIERKFLADADALAPLLRDRGCLHIVQHYFEAPAGFERRLRVVTETAPDGSPGRRRAVTNTKGPRDGIARPETADVEIPLERALAFATQAVATLVKRRYRLAAGNGLTWEIDLYETPKLAPENGRAVAVAEIELPSPDTELAFPDWIIREITQDRNWDNAALAQPVKGDRR